MSLFYLLFVPACVMLALQVRYLWRVRNRDRVLFGFRRLRSEIMAFILDNVDSLSREDYRFARQILRSIDGAEACHEQKRYHLFNIRGFVRFLKQYTMTEEEIMALPRTDRAELKQFENRLAWCFFRGFVAHTPFMASEVVAKLTLQLAILIARLPATLGSRAAKKAYAITKSAAAAFDRQRDEIHSGGMRYA